MKSLEQRYADAIRSIGGTFGLLAPGSGQKENRR